MISRSLEISNTVMGEQQALDTGTASRGLNFPTLIQLAAKFMF